MVIVRNNFNTGLNLDSSYDSMPPTSYINALNITRNSISGNSDNDITNVVGNRIATFSYPAGTNQTIGAYAYPLRDAVYFFNYNSTGKHGVYEFIKSSRTITKVFENLTDSNSVDILGFTINGKINNVNIYPRDEGDLLFFLDSLGRPTQMNITEFKAGTYTPATRQLINVIKAPPLSPPSSIYDNDTTRRANNLIRKQFRFKYRWVYDDYERSVCSPISAMPRPLNVLNDDYTSVITNNNVISISLNSGAKNVKSVEILVSVSDATNEWSDFMLVEDYDKATNSISDDTVFSYQFYNDSTYPVIDINQSIQLYDFVPDAALAQELANGNVLIYGAITEGYDKDLTPNVVNVVSQFAAGGSSGGTGTLGAVNSFNVGGLGLRIMQWTFTGVPATGTLITVTYKRASDGVTITGSTYTTVAGDNFNDVISNLVSSNTAPFVAASHPLSGILQLNIQEAVYQLMPNGLYSTVTITPPATSLDPNSIPAWKWSSERNIGIAYFDQNGKTNGILYNAKITFPAYTDDISNNVYLPSLDTKIYHVPPIWAYSFQFYFTKDATQYIYWASVDVNVTEPNYIYFDVTNFGVNAARNPTTSQVLSYTFQDGDRLRLIKPIGTTTFYSDTMDAPIVGLVTDPKINGSPATGTFIKVKTTTAMNHATFAVNNHVYLIELYRPSQQSAGATNQPYFEFGRQYPILDPTTITRRHAGQVTDQSSDYVTPAEFTFLEGDSYFRRRSIALTDTSIATYYAEDRNFVDFYNSAVSSFDGRPNAIDVNARTAFFGATIRFGQAYQANTNLNGLNRFYPNNLEDLDLTYGNILRMKARDRFVRTFQQYKVGRVPLYSQITKDGTGNFVQVVTDKLLNPVQYDVGDFGIGDQPESLASHDYADWFTTNIKGAVCRVSNNGVDNISELYFVDSWATANIPLRTGSSHIYGAFDQRTSKYIMALEAATGSDAQTLSFDVRYKSFESFLSYQPEMMCTLGTLLISFKNGALYTHDNTSYNVFYGTTYNSYVTFCINESPLSTKTFNAIEQISSVIWSAPEISTSLDSYSGTKQASNLIESDFEENEGKYDAAFMQDTNSISGLINGNDLRGNYMLIKLQRSAPTSLISLSGFCIRVLDSALNLVNSR